MSFNNYQKIILPASIAVGTGCLVYSAAPNYNLHIVMWFAFVPILLAMDRWSKKEVYFYTLLMGSVLSSLMFLWLPYAIQFTFQITSPWRHLIWLAYCIFHAHAFALTFLSFVIIREKSSIPDQILFPVILVCIWSAFPALYPYMLSNGVASSPISIQAIDITGSYGLDFMIAFTNISFYKIVKHKKDFIRSSGFKIFITLLTLWFGYGAYSLNHWGEKIANWPKKNIGIIQPNYTHGKGNEYYNETNRLEHLFKLSKTINQSLDLIVWPEGLNLFYGFRPNIAQVYKEKTATLNVPLIFHGYQIDKDNKTIIHNTSYLLNKKGELQNRYNKRKLVLFGEYIPILGYQRNFTNKYNLSPSTTPGFENVTFDVSGMKIQPLICYESVFNQFIAKSITSDPVGKIFLIQSNSIHYGPGNQSEQHLTFEILRAVEHRMPLIHVSNNGPSSIISPVGRIEYLAKKDTMKSERVELPYSLYSGGSFFTKHYTLFLSLCFGTLTIVIVELILRRWWQQALTRFTDKAC